MEDLGRDLVVDGDPPLPVVPRYEAAADLLAALHRTAMPDVLPVEAGVDYTLPRYDLDAFLIEVELMADWYLPRLDVKLAGSRRDDYVELWRNALKPALGRAAGLGAARLSFAQPAVAAGTRRRGPRRPARFPGRGDGAGGL